MIRKENARMPKFIVKGKVYQFDDDGRWQQIDAGVKASAMEENNVSN